MLKNLKTQLYFVLTTYNFPILYFLITTLLNKLELIPPHLIEVILFLFCLTQNYLPKGQKILWARIIHHLTQANYSNDKLISIRQTYLFFDLKPGWYLSPMGWAKIAITQLSLAFIINSTFDYFPSIIGMIIILWSHSEVQLTWFIELVLLLILALSTLFQKDLKLAFFLICLPIPYLFNGKLLWDDHLRGFDRSTNYSIAQFHKFDRFNILKSREQKQSQKKYDEIIEKLITPNIDYNLADPEEIISQSKKDLEVFNEIKNGPITRRRDEQGD